jgi:ribosome-associated protein
VRDAVRDAGFPKPRMEGETNGEWIIVDCGAAVVHVMQPNFRQYYNLEELWGEKPVRLKFGATKPAVAESEAPAKPVKKVVEVEGSLRRSNAAKKGVAEAFPSKAQLKKTADSAAAKSPARKAAAKKTIASKTPTKSPAVKVTSKTIVINAPEKAASKKASPKAPAKAAAKKAPAKKTVAKKSAAD